MLFYLPSNINFILIKNTFKKRNYILIYNQYQYLYILYKNIIYKKSTSFLILNKKNYSKEYLHTVINCIENLSLFFLKKIKFKGKG
jgi:hypothetical protein